MAWLRGPVSRTFGPGLAHKRSGSPLRDIASTQMAEEVGEVVIIDSQSWIACRLCGEGVGSAMGADMADLEIRINHLLAEHDATVLHVGQHTGRSFEGDPFQHVVAVLGLPR